MRKTLSCVSDNVDLGNNDNTPPKVLLQNSTVSEYFLPGLLQDMYDSIPTSFTSLQRRSLLSANGYDATRLFTALYSLYLFLGRV